MANNYDGNSISVLEGLDQKETEVLTAALKKLQRFFDSYKTE